jgi:hypothetical protein
MRRTRLGMSCLNNIFLMANMFLLDFPLEILLGASLLVDFACPGW